MTPEAETLLTVLRCAVAATSFSGGLCVAHEFEQSRTIAIVVVVLSTIMAVVSMASERGDLAGAAGLMGAFWLLGEVLGSIDVDGWEE